MTFPKFIISGGINTGVTYLLYLGLLLYIPYKWAYSVTFIIGIFLGYLLNSKWVFKKKISMFSIMVYPFIYLLNYLLGITIIGFIIESLHVAKEIAPLIVVVITVPIMYILTKFIFLRRTA